jgi:hypothetical protein
MSERAQGANPAATSKKKSKQYGAGRECAEDDCGTVLSRYNPGLYCSRHEHLTDARRESQKARTIGEESPT